MNKIDCASHSGWMTPPTFWSAMENFLTPSVG
jgi:hypothetical protein